VALKSDFLELDKYLDGGKKSWKLRYGLPYWMINKDGQIENDCYILTENTDVQEFGMWLNLEQVLIPVRRFENKNIK